MKLTNRYNYYRVYTVIRLRDRTREVGQIRLLVLHDPRLHSDPVHGADPATGADRTQAMFKFRALATHVCVHVYVHVPVHSLTFFH